MSEPTRRAEPCEDGSIVISVVVAMIVAGLITALMATVFQGLKVSRRSGDSANALQVADAGVNHAVGEIPKKGSTIGSFSVGPVAVGNGSYEYTAVKDFYQPAPHVPAVPVWHISALGTDEQGVQRRVNADAVAHGLFGQAIFVAGTGLFGTGLAVDSYIDGLTADNRCSGVGAVGSNDPAKLFFGPSSNGVPNSNPHNNCKSNPALTNPWQWPADACIAYGPGDDSQPYPPGAGTTGHCPTIRSSPGIYPGTWKTSPLFRPGTVRAPTGTGPEYIRETSTFECHNGTKKGPANQLQAGKVYIVPNLILRDGCQVIGGDPATAETDAPGDPAAGAAKVFVTGDVALGSQTGGANNLINEPPQNAATAGGPCGQTGQQSAPNSYYCPGWPKTLQIYVVGDGTVTFDNNGMKMWGLIHAAEATASFSAPQLDVWGSMIISSVGGSGSSNSPQWSWHYDESLQSMTTGLYQLANWREEPLS